MEYRQKYGNIPFYGNLSEINLDIFQNRVSSGYGI